MVKMRYGNLFKTLLHPHSFRKRLLLINICFLSLILTFSAVATYMHFYYSTAELISDNLNFLVKSEVEKLDDFVQNSSNFLDKLTQEFSTHFSGSSKPGRDTITTFLKRLAPLASLNFDTIFVADSQGNLIASYPDIQGVRKLFPHKEEFMRYLYAEKQYIPLPYKLEILNSPSFVICNPVRFSTDTFEAFCGAVNLLDSHNPFGRLLDKRVGNTGYMYLISRDRLLILHPNRSRVLKRDVPPGANKLLDKALNGFEGIGRTINSRGLHTFVGFKRMETTGWILGANYPEKDALEGVWRFGMYSVIALILFLLFSAALSFYSGKMIMVPLTSITNKLRYMVETDVKNWDMLQTSYLEEIDMLVSSFNRLIGEIKKRDNKLRDSEIRYRILVDRIPETVFEADLNGNITFVNSSGMRTFRVTKEDVERGVNIFDLVLPEDHDKVKRGLERVLNGDVKDYIEFRAKRLDGTTFFARGISFPTIKGGRTVGIFGFVMDISDIKEKQEKISRLNAELLEANQRLNLFKEAVESSPLSIVITDSKGNIEYVNPQFTKLTGYTFEEARGENPRILKSGIHTEEFYKEMWNTILAGREWIGEICNKKKDGSIFWERAFIKGIKSEDGNITHFVAVKEDITDAIERDKALKEALKIAKEANKKLTAILDQQESIVVLMQPSRGIWYINKRFFELFPYRDLDDFSSKHKCLCELYIEREGYLPPCKDNNIEEFMNYVLQLDKPNLVMMLDKDGKERIFSLRAQPIELEMENLIVLSLTDVTELEDARQRALAAERAKTNFLANMSHEIRTPLNAIAGFADLLARTELNVTQARYVSIIKASIDTLLHVVNAILDLAKIEAGKMEIEYVAINPYREFDSLLLLFEPLAINKDICFSYHIDPRLHECLIVGNYALKQIMTNLVNNAVKFSPRGGEVEVRIEVIEDMEDRQTVKFYVRDTGEGIPEDKLDIIFDRFTQADSSVTRKYGGTGLGLSIVKALVEAMGGEVGVYSKVGEGSTFFFTLTFRKCVPETSILSTLAHCNVCVSCTDETVHFEATRCLRLWNIPYENFDYAHVRNRNIKYKVGIFSSQDELKKYKQFVECMIVVGSNAELSDSDKPDIIIKMDKITTSSLYNALIKCCKKADLALPVYFLQTDHLEMNVLVAEDNEVNRMLMEELLKEQGVQVTFAENGKEAVELVRRGNYDVIFMDIDMPVMDGFEATREIRKFNPHIPIIALTAYAISGFRDKIIKAGMNEYITKPVDVKALRSVLEKFGRPSPPDNLKASDPCLNKAVYLPSILKRAEEELGLPREVIQRLFDKFMESFKSVVKNMEECLNKGNFDEIRKLGHSLKGSAGSIRLEDISAIGKAIEEASVNGDEEKIRNLLEKLKDKLELLTGATSNGR